jgi:hypothetical protein
MAVDNRGAPPGVSRQDVGWQSAEPITRDILTPLAHHNKGEPMLDLTGITALQDLRAQFEDSTPAEEWPAAVITRAKPSPSRQRMTSHDRPGPGRVIGVGKHSTHVFWRFDEGPKLG